MHATYLRVILLSFIGKSDDFTTFDTDRRRRKRLFRHANQSSRDDGGRHIALLFYSSR